MPSGSHGGSPGSHSSGGASSGRGGSSSGSRGSSYSRGGSSYDRGYEGRYHGGIHMSFGGGGHGRGMRGGPRGVRFGGTASVTIMLIVIFIGFFLSIIGLTFFLGVNQPLKKIETDYYYYQDMIAYAEEHPEYIKTGYIVDRFYNEDVDKYWIEYKVAMDEPERLWLKGYTFSCYTREEIYTLQIGSEISIAVNSIPVILSTDSIPMDYKNMPLSKDGEWAKLHKQKVLGVVLLVGGIAFMVVSIAVSVHVFVKNKQKTESKTEN